MPRTWPCRKSKPRSSSWPTSRSSCPIQSAGPALRDKKVGAVAGLVEVGNRVNILTDFQHQEYVVTQDVVRRRMNSLTMPGAVPGAVKSHQGRSRKRRLPRGSHRRRRPDRRRPWRGLSCQVREERARSITEAPVTTRAFLRQRLRWQLGMLQVDWKHLARAGLGSASRLFHSQFDLVGPVSLLLALLRRHPACRFWAPRSMRSSCAKLCGGALPILLFTSYFMPYDRDRDPAHPDRFLVRAPLWMSKTLLLSPLLRFGYRKCCTSPPSAGCSVP